VSNSGANKRRRTAADTLHISDLPIGFIADVSAYLPKPSRAILAVAFTSSSLWQNDNLMHRLSPISKAIISASQWNILDFEDVEKELANKLTDDDISAVLNSINAQDVLKRLKLCGCINITGIGLNLLRGSAVLEQIDFSLVGKHETQQKISESKISHEVVVPILDSIISSDGCSLKHIAFPISWCRDEEGDPLEQMRVRYINMFTRRSSSLSCSHCNANMRGNDNWFSSGNLQNNICYDCLEPFCNECVDTSELLKYCGFCRKDYCPLCVVVEDCSDERCGWVCNGCKKSCDSDGWTPFIVRIA